MINIELPFWMGGARLAKLVEIFTAWWALAEEWMRWPHTQTDPLTCAVPMLRLLAWARDIQPLPDESLDFFRKRVAFAYVDAYDAGEKQGFINIFARLGIGPLIEHERFDVVNWDVIGLELYDGQIAGNETLLAEIIRAYGRTCRRYQFTVNSPTPCSTGLITVGVDYTYSKASIEL